MLGAFFMFLGVLLIFLIAFSIVMASSSIEHLKGHWEEEKCTLAGLFFAWKVKPDSDTRTPTEFSKENFKFCMGKKTTDTLQTSFGPLGGVFRKVLASTKTLTDVMGAFRGILKNLQYKFQSLMSTFFVKFVRIGTLTSKIFQHLWMSMKKTVGIAIASLFAGLSIVTATYNAVDFFLKVIIIILWVLTALALIFFIPIIPVFFLVWMAVNGIEGALPGRTGALGSIFCFAPGTPVVTASGQTVPIETLQLGHTLKGGAKVEAVIQLQGATTPIYTLRGVKVSGDHRVWSESCKTWCLVKEHPEAAQLWTAPDQLWTLITSNREIPVQTSSGILNFADWEELPDTFSAATIWEYLVRDILPTSSVIVPEEAPALDPKAKIKKFQSGWVSISEIQVGDWVQGEKRWTRVLGICRRKVHGGTGAAGSRITDGVWVKDSDGRWTHSLNPSDKCPWIGNQLITDTGEFRVMLQGCERIVRDFTEVGWDSLETTYARVLNAMPPKKEDSTIVASK